MSPESLAYLERPGLRRLLFAARERFERNGGPLGKLSLQDMTPDEAHALNGLLAPQQPYRPGHDAHVKLARLDAQLRGSRLAVSLEEALVAVDGPLVDVRAERAVARSNRAVAWTRVLAHPMAARPELEPWLDHVRKRWAGSAGSRYSIVLRALDVLAVLPADGIPLAALAATHAGGDAHALDRGRPLGRLLPAALLALEGALPRDPTTVEEWRALWARFGVSCDELSCTVLSLGLRVRMSARGYLAGRLRAAGRAGRPLVTTLAELRAEPPRLTGEVLFVCENPSIVAAAAAELGPACPPLLCTSGWPNTAVAMVLDAAVAAGMRILVHADGDAAGAAIAGLVLRRRGARPWREVLADSGIHEEAVLAELLEDLRGTA